MNRRIILRLSEKIMIFIAALFLVGFAFYMQVGGVMGYLYIGLGALMAVWKLYEIIVIIRGMIRGENRL